MARPLIACFVLLLATVGSVCAAGRLAVLEFFGRPTGAYCAAAGPAMLTLQEEYDGRAVLLEYDYDRFNSGRLYRFWATGVSANYLPLVMVGSGYRVSHGQVSYEAAYRDMLEDELRRPPRASVAAAWRRSGTTMRTYLTLTNTGSATLRTSEDAALWVIAYEKATVGVSSTWVRATAYWPLPTDLAPGETVDAVVDLPGLSSVSWDRMAAVALVEDRPGGAGAYDMAQAVAASPAAIGVTPRQVLVHPGRPEVEVKIDGPHVLQWIATVDVPWLEVTPSSGVLPGVATVRLVEALRPASTTTATLTVRATGDSMDFSTLLPVTVGAPVRHPSRRLAPDG